MAPQLERIYGEWGRAAVSLAVHWHARVCPRALPRGREARDA